MFGAKAVDYCNPEDPICHAGQGNEWKGHTDGYVPVYTSQAASFVATRLLSVLPQTGPDGAAGCAARTWLAPRSKPVARSKPAAWPGPDSRPCPRRPGPDRGRPDPAGGVSLITRRNLICGGALLSGHDAALHTHRDIDAPGRVRRRRVCAWCWRSRPSWPPR